MHYHQSSLSDKVWCDDMDVTFAYDMLEILRYNAVM